MKFFKLIDTLIEKVSAWFLVLSILLILICSSMSIFLRWGHINLPWIDPFVRHLVLIGTFLGGVIATGRGNHIGIDLISKLLEVKGHHKTKIIVNRIILLFSSLVLILMVKAGIDFTKVEMEFSKVEFFGIGSGQLVMIIPIGLSIIALRFFTLFIISFSSDYTLKKTGEI